jgi:hypothetical protein
VKSHQQHFEDPLEYACALPLPKPIPTSHAAAPKFPWKVLPGNPSAQNEHDARQGNPVGRTRAASPPSRGMLGEEWLDDRP